MGIFRNDNETAYTGGRKHWTDVIKNSGDGSLLVWRQPEEDFNTNSTLIVMPGEQAIFIKGGNIEQVFDSGTYKLSTENYPFISRLRNAFTGGVSTFNCVVYFVRTAHSEEIEWGTMSPIQYWDDTFGNLSIKSYGAYKVQVSNPAKFITKLVGNNTQFESANATTIENYKDTGKTVESYTETREGLNAYFRNEFQMHIVNAISRTLDSLKASEGKDIFAYANNVMVLSEAISPSILPILDDYGLRLITFSVASCKIQSDDPEINKMIADRKRMEYLGQVDMSKIGSGWQAQQQVDILKNISVNPGAGGVAGVGAGLGMGIAAGGAFGNMAQQQFGQQGLQQQPQANPVIEKLKQLKDLLDMGLISQEDYDAKKKEILLTL